MHFRAVLNREGGTLKTMDLDAFAAFMRETLAEAGHTLDVHTVAGGDIVTALEEAAADAAADAVIAGGGDGTVSAAAAVMMRAGKALAVLPTGTMNLFARTLRIPLDPEQAVRAFARGVLRDVDMASAGDRYFVHQYSVGLHPEMVRLRSRMDFAGRTGKIGASTRAALAAFLRPPRVRVALAMGSTEIKATVTALSITNNLYGEGHLPYAEKPDGGVLGIYLTRAWKRRDLLWFVLNMAIGRWRGNDQVEIREAADVTLRIGSRRHRYRCAIDGELSSLGEETVIRCHPGALRVLVPDERGNGEG